MLGENLQERIYCCRVFLYADFRWEFRIEERESSGEKRFVGRSSFLQSRSLGNGLIQKKIIVRTVPLRTVSFTSRKITLLHLSLRQFIFRVS